MNTILVVVHLFLAIALVGLILIQHGKGADAGAAFGSGASSTVFGSRGSANFLSRTTGVLALLFFITSMALAAVALKDSRKQESLMEGAVDVGAPIVMPETDVPGTDIPAIPEEAASGGVPEVSDIPVVEVEVEMETPETPQQQEILEVPVETE